MNIQHHTKKMYDQYGHLYQKTRDEHHSSRAYNEFLEVPAMFKAVGNIKGKKLLDLGCGAGVHIQHYLKKGAKCWGRDISKTMLDLAKKRCPTVDFTLGSITQLPYKDNSFDLVISSLCLDYVKDIDKAFKETQRVLKKGGLFYFSDESPIAAARERYEDDKFIIAGLGKFVDKKTGKQISLGKAWDERVCTWEMVPGMALKTYSRTFRTKLLQLRKAGFELVDFIDCKPTLGFKKLNPKEYAVFSKIPMFSIYVVQKK